MRLGKERLRIANGYAPARDRPRHRHSATITGRARPEGDLDIDVSFLITAISTDEVGCR